MKRNKVVIFVCILIVVSLYFNASDKIPSYAYEVRPEHPRIYINSDNIEAIRARLANSWGIQQAYYSEMKRYVESVMETEVVVTNRTSPQRLTILAFLYVIKEIPGISYVNYSIDDFGAKGVEYLKAFADHYSKHRPEATYWSKTCNR